MGTLCVTLVGVILGVIVSQWLLEQWANRHYARGGGSIVCYAGQVNHRPLSGRNHRRAADPRQHYLDQGKHPDCRHYCGYHRDGSFAGDPACPVHGSKAARRD